MFQTADTDDDNENGSWKRAKLPKIGRLVRVRYETGKRLRNLYQEEMRLKVTERGRGWKRKPHDKSRRVA